MKQETLTALINLAHLYQVAADRRKKQWTREELIVHAVASEQDDTLDPEHKALFRFIEALTDEEKHEAMALLWVGRGDDESYEVALRAARLQNPATVAPYLTGKNDLDQYLLRGANRRLGITEVPHLLSGDLPERDD